MPCYTPLDAWMHEGRVVFHVPGATNKDFRKHGDFQLPCGQCIGCRLERSRQWAVRCMHEAAMHDSSVFITLTYDDEHAPYDKSLNYRDFQLFCKRLRKKLGKFRFFMCGEYGDDFGRPHFHACIFGLHFDDREIFRELPNGSRLYRSRTLESLWPFGYSTIGDVTFESAAYVARYCVKKITGEQAMNHYLIELDDGTRVWRTPEFAHMSLKPGIGYPFFEKYKDEILDWDQVVMRGVVMKPPRAYDRKVKGYDVRFDDNQYSRYLRSLDMRDDATAERLAVRHSVAKARLKTKSRSL